MLSEKTKTEVIDYLADSLRSTMFGDGLEDDYIRCGMGFKGLENMTDQELLDEMSDLDEDDELLIKVKQELEVEKLLSDDKEVEIKWVGIQ